jgi:hypothetical protein
MIFFCNKNRKHWINFALYPKKRLICVIDLFGDPATTYAMIIFRWLYDDMHFNWPEDVKNMFLAYKPCGGWTYRVDPKCSQCGVWTLANVSCLMIGINMDILTEAVIERFRKLIFSRLCSFNITCTQRRYLHVQVPIEETGVETLTDRLPALGVVVTTGQLVKSSRIKIKYSNIFTFS